MPENDKNDQKPQPGTDDKRDKTLTEKEEEKASGENKKTPGPVYDVDPCFDKVPAGSRDLLNASSARGAGRHWRACPSAGPDAPEEPRHRNLDHIVDGDTDKDADRDRYGQEDQAEPRSCWISPRRPHAVRSTPSVRICVR